MRKEIFKKIKDKYGNYSSFAIWGDDLSDASIIEENVDILHGRVVFVGWNVSRQIKKFQNFHFKHRGGRDSWLKEALNNSVIFRGSYMTDLIKGRISSKIKDLNINKDEELRNLRIFEKEMSLLEKKPVLVLFGNNTFNLAKILSRDVYSDLYKISHYAKHGIKKDEFFNEIRELERIMKI